MQTHITEAPLFNPVRDRTNWFLVLFGLGFAGFGIHLIAMGVRGLLAEQPGSAEVMQVACGFIFAGMGSMVVFFSLQDGRARADRAERSARHPMEPWRWRADWAAGRIPCAGRASALGFLAFAVVWNAFCIPLLWAVPSSDAPFVWLFVIVGMGFATAAGLATWRWLRFGRSLLELVTLPGRPGGRLQGTVHLRGSLRAQKGFRATLSCVAFTSGKNSQQRVLWQEEGLIPAAAASPGPIGIEVPLDFPIAGDVQASSFPGGSSGIRWEVELTAELTGVDFAATFEVPVFHADGPPPQSAQDEAGSGALELGPVLQPEAPMDLDRGRYTPDSPNRLGLLDAGVVEARLPAARNKGRAVFFTAFTFVWSSFTALAWLGAPLLFGILFVAAWMVLVLTCLTLWLRSWRIVASGSGVAATSSYLGIGWTRRIPAIAIAKIVPQIADESNKRPYYELQIHRTSGPPVKIGDGVRSKREAEWLCSALWSAVRGSSDDKVAASSNRSR